MSTAGTNQPAAKLAHEAHDEHAHTPHLAHHFDTMGQQFDAGKLGMWIFLATEILMFGGLFCAYAVYRANNPDVFAFAHKELNTTLGAINTVVLIASSLTMAWAVRCAQLGQNRGLVLCLSLSLLGGFGFLSIKTIEYHKKYEHHLWIGAANEYHPKFIRAEHLDAVVPVDEGKKASDPPVAAPVVEGSGVERSTLPVPSAGPGGVRAEVQAGIAMQHEHAHGVAHGDLAQFDQGRLHIFFQVYYMMTGLHGIHVLIGMALMFWILLRAVRPAARKWVAMLAPAALFAFIAYVGAIIGNWTIITIGLGAAVVFGCVAIYLYDKARRQPREGTGEFGPNYFLPVDLVGLYWHLVDLIWIFLFPLLYLIH